MKKATLKLSDPLSKYLHSFVTIIILMLFPLYLKIKATKFFLQDFIRAFNTFTTFKHVCATFCYLPSLAQTDQGSFCMLLIFSIWLILCFSQLY